MPAELSDSSKIQFRKQCLRNLLNQKKVNHCLANRRFEEAWAAREAVNGCGAE